jgi:hypothetical protein
MSMKIKPEDLEQGCVYLGTGGPNREIVRIDRRNHLLYYRKSGSLELHELKIPKFVEWAVMDITEKMGKEGALRRGSKVQEVWEGIA